MEIRIAAPNKSHVKELFNYREDLCKKLNIKLFIVDENKCAELLLRNRVDIALLTPIGYGSGLGEADFHIVPVSAVSLVGYSGLASIFFKKELITINTIAAAYPKDYLTRIATLLLAERYGMHPEIIAHTGSKSEIPTNADAAVLYHKSDAEQVALDVGEEWFDAFEMPLPYLFWVCKSQEYPTKIINLLNEFSPIPTAEKNIEIKDSGALDPLVRQGEIIREFNDDIENALEQTLQFLFFHQHFENIPAVKILGRDDDKIPLINN